MNVEGILDIQVDFSAGGISIFFDKLQPYGSQWNAAAFNGLIFTYLDGATLPFDTLTVIPQVYMPGFGQLNVIYFGSNSFGFNWAGLPYDVGNPNLNGDGVAVQVAVAVPEPATLPLVLGAAALGLWASRRRRA